MSDNKSSQLDFESDDPRERQLWEQLTQLPTEEPSPNLRQNFYRNLHKASQPTVFERMRAYLGLRGSAGFITATACLVLGLALGNLIDSPTTNDEPALADLQQQVDQLHRNLILDRLQSPSPSKRLRGVIDASEYANDDPELAGVLLTLATQDKVTTIRSAAIDALGPQLSAPAVGDELMALLDNDPSPLVQFALVDLVLRHGSQTQIEKLLLLSTNGALNPELSDYVQSALGRNAA